MDRPVTQRETSRTLQGKTILITRAPSQAGEFADGIRRLGGNPVFFSTIDIQPPESWEECDRALQRIDLYDGLIFTSVNGFEFFFQRIQELKLPLDNLKSKRIYAVGAKTKSAIENYGLAVTAISEVYTAEHLVEVLSAENLRGKAFLFPRGNLSRDVLVDRLRTFGAVVDTVVVYQTKKPEPENIEYIRTLLGNGKIDVITFASPSSVQNFIEMFSPQELRDFHRYAKIAAIGPATKEAIEAYEVTPDIVAEESTMNGLTESIAQYSQSNEP